MQIIKEHIEPFLKEIIESEENVFNSIYESLRSDNKEKFKPLLKYLYKVLYSLYNNKEPNELNIHSIHFEIDYCIEEKTLIAEFVWFYFFITANSSDNNDKNNVVLQNKIDSIKKTLKSDVIAPPDNNRRVFNQLINERRKLRKILKHYKSYPENSTFFPCSLMNLKVIQYQKLTNLFEDNPFFIQIQELNNLNSYTLINTESFDSIKRINLYETPIFKVLENIILFDCEDRIQKFNQFNAQNLDNLNQRHGTNFKSLILITFGSKNNSLNEIKEKQHSTKDRFKIPKESNYTVLQSEIDFVLKQKTKKHISVSFIGSDNSDLWNAFILETSIQDLYELRSIKMMNLYSLCFNKEIKDFILQDIFLEKDTSELISDETKQRLLDLSEEDISALKDSLGNVLDLIISSDFKRELSNKIKNETILVVDDFILKTKNIKQLFSSSLQLSSENKLSSWSDFKNLEGGNILILSYQDQGKYPYYFYPNVIETTVSKNMTIEAVYHKFLFLIRYQWAKYNATNDLYKLSDHPIRQKYFQWKGLKDVISSLRPQKADNTNWDLEQQYSGNTNRETIKLKLKGEREKTFNNSELFIYSTDEKCLRVEKIGDIIASIDEDEKCFVHHLDEIQENINLYEKMTDTSQQEEELNIIRQQFQLNDSETGRLWKLLLKKKVLNSNEEILYDELKTYLESKGLKIVSLFHFKNNWLNPESESIAPLSKKVFIELCNFLNLPKTYFILIQRLRNASKQSSRQSTRQMNRLLQDLFNDGCFDKGVDISNIIKANLESHKRKHPLDELGIDEKYLGKNLITLVELIQSEVKLKELEKFKKIE